MDTDWQPSDLSPSQRKEMADHYFKHMIYGVLWCVGGTVATVLSFSSGRGGVLFWGAIIFGIYDFFKGLGGWLKFR
jgi:hypothetical protein